MKIPNKRTILMVLMIMGAPFLMIYALIFEDRAEIRKLKNLLRDLFKELTDGN